MIKYDIVGPAPKSAVGPWGAEHFYVESGKGTVVAAKWLKDDAGRYVINPADPYKRPYMVPKSFEMKEALRLGRELREDGERSRLFENTPLGKAQAAVLERIIKYPKLVSLLSRGGTLDVQRTLPEKLPEGDMVEPFTDAASYIYGAVGYEAGMPDLEMMFAGGVYNIGSRLKASVRNTIELRQGPVPDLRGTWANSPSNAVSICVGQSDARKGRWHSGGSLDADYSNDCPKKHPMPKDRRL